MIYRNQAATKKKLRKQRLVRVTASVIMVLLTIFSLWLIAASLSPDFSLTNCVALREPSVGIVYKANASKVTVKPWLGEHHVYALFAIPNQYQYNEALPNVSPAIVTVKNVDKTLQATRANPKLYGLLTEIPKDHFFVIAFLWTRETIWHILQGKYSELTNPCNWTIYIKG